jgi:hypothetical protein
VSVLALHASVAESTQERAAQHVGALDALAFPGFAASAVLGGDALCGFEVFDADQRLVYHRVGPDPGIRVVPAHPGLVAEADVMDVE